MRKTSLVLPLLCTGMLIITAAGSPQHAQGDARIQVQSPLPDERWIADEPIVFRASASAPARLDGKELRWSSSLDGNLGTGPAVRVRKLTPGRHVITVSGYGAEKTVSIRVFTDLWEFYRAPQAPTERERIARDFTFLWLDGQAQDERWQTFAKVGFNQSSPDPSVAIVVAKLDVLRHQRFSEPLPFAGGKSIYEHVRTYIKKIAVNLSCQVNTGGHGTVNLNRNFSVWDLRESGTAQDPDACKKTHGTHPLGLYTHPLYLLVHEARHSEPGDPGHVECRGKGNMDSSLENGSGHAAAALYLMWVFRYGVSDPPAVRDNAKVLALSLLKSRFCQPPTHSNPKVQAILTEILK